MGVVGAGDEGDENGAVGDEEDAVEYVWRG